MKLKIFESENLDFRKSAPSSRSDQVKASMGEWPNQEEINRNFRELVKRELVNPDNIEITSDGHSIVNLNHLSRESYKCTDFSRMFIYQDDPIDVSEWDVSRGQDFHGMFASMASEAAALLDVSKWDVSNGKRFNSMFEGSSTFNSDISEWDVSSCVDFRLMFDGVYKGFNQDLSKWDVSNGKHFNRMFYNCRAFTGKGLENWDVSNGVSFMYMFAFTEQLDCDLSKWDTTPPVSSMDSPGYHMMFSGSKLERQPHKIPPKAKLALIIESRINSERNYNSSIY